MMSILRDEDEHVNIEFGKYQSVAIGPGLGKTDLETKLLKQVLENYSGSLVLDADALNALSKQLSLLSALPKKTILTPHVKEFDRIFGEHNSWWERVSLLRKPLMNTRSSLV